MYIFKEKFELDKFRYNYSFIVIIQNLKLFLPSKFYQFSVCKQQSLII